MIHASRKRSRHTDSNVQLNTTIFQSLLIECTTEKLLQAATFANECNYQIDNSYFYGCYSNESSISVFEVLFQQDIIPKVTIHSLMIILSIFLMTNAQLGLQNKSIYGIIFQPSTVSSVVLDWLITNADKFSIDTCPSAVNISTRNHPVQKLSPKDTKIIRFQKLVHLTALHSNAYNIFNRFEHFKQKSTNALFSSIYDDQPLYVKLLLETSPLVDLDVYTSKWETAEEWCERTEGENNYMIRNLINTSRHNLEKYRQHRASIVDKLHEQNILPLDLCKLINSYGERPS